MTMQENCLLSREPIFDGSVGVAGYELHTHLPGESPSRTVYGAFNDSGLDSIVGGHSAVISLTPEALSEDLWKPIPHSRAVLGFFEDFAPSDAAAHKMSQLISSNYRIALSDSLCSGSLDALGNLAYVIKLDLTSYLPDELEKRVETLRKYKAKLLAAKVDTYDDLEFSKSLGFDFYQGVFLSKPAAQKRQLATNRLAVLRLLAKLSDPELEMSDLEKLVSQDVSLSYKLLQYANSAAVALPRKVTSVGHAVRLLGIVALRMWSSVLLLSRVDDKPRELMNVALVRARMCERLGEFLPDAKKESFLSAGLLSVLDALLDCPMEQVLAELPLADEIKEALIHQSGPIGQALRCTVAYERSHWDDVQFYGLSHAPIRDSYIDAIAWSRNVLSGLVS
jgi:EAL and modified HD-GYP domain-containing signal transduction protein